MMKALVYYLTILRISARIESINQKEEKLKSSMIHQKLFLSQRIVNRVQKSDRNLE